MKQFKHFLVCAFLWLYCRLRKHPTLPPRSVPTSMSTAEANDEAIVSSSGTMSNQTYVQDTEAGTGARTGTFPLMLCTRSIGVPAHMVDKNRRLCPASP